MDPLGSTGTNLFDEPSAPTSGLASAAGGLHWEVLGNHWTKSPLLPVPLEIVCFP